MKCAMCKKSPEELPEYVSIAVENDLGSAEEAVKRMEGTYHSGFDLFLCTSCYIKAGQPLLPEAFEMYRKQKVAGV